jgi:hypothetical protein
LRKRSPYTWTGLGLLLAGGALLGAAFFIFNQVWLSALGIAMLIMSFILLALGRTIPNVPPEVCSLLLETGIDNIATLIEELGIRARAIYIPSSPSYDRPRAFIPLNANGSTPQITRDLPRRLIARYGANPEDVGLLIATVGSSAAGMLTTKPGARPDELELALTSLFAGRLGIADGARVSCQDKYINIEIDKPRLKNSADWSHHCLGGPLAAIAASVAAESWGKPVRIAGEELRHGKYHIGLEVMG